MHSGLSTKEVSQRLMEYGRNEVPAQQYRMLRLFLRQFRGVFNLLLLAASVVTLLLGEPIDAGFILLFVILSVLLSFLQEYKSNAAADTLRSYLVRTVTVRRDGVDVEVLTTELVPGDLLKLESGDIVPADAVLRHATSVRVDETSFSGENLPIDKNASDEIASGVPESARLWQGTIVLRGTAYAEVTETGKATRLAHLASTGSVSSNTSVLTKSVDRISTFILKTTLVTLVFVVVANILIDGSGTDIPHLLIFAIALAVSVIPEALPLVMTFSLSSGALRLAKEHVIVKRLTSVQDLGSVELLCTDKTGTITENRLLYQNDYLIPESSFHPLVLARLAAHDLNERVPEPFDVALDEALLPDQRSEVSTYDTLEEEAFDPDLRSNGAVVRRTDGLVLHIRRGSPEYFFGQQLVAEERVQEWLDEEEALGRRVLGVSYDDGSGDRFGGFVSFADSLKSTTEQTVQTAKELNVAITIITGDAVRVAEAVGRETGIVTSSAEVTEASHFFALSASEQLQRIGTIRVFARTTPEQKLALIELMKQQYTVGFLGEGINDAPALKAADVSIVVQSASDVARETADIILTRADLKAVVEGIRLGRETHANTLKYIRTTLVSNFGNFYAVAISSLFISFLPMLPKQLLLLNLLSDVPMMAIAFDRVSNSETALPQRYNFRSLYIIFITLGLVSTVFDFMWFALFYQISPGVLQTNWFIASVLTEVVLLFSIRSMLPIERAGWPSPVVIGLSAFACLTALILPYVAFVAAFFEFTPPSPEHVLLILCLTGLYFVITEFAKRPVARFLGTQA